MSLPQAVPPPSPPVQTHYPYSVAAPIPFEGDSPRLADYLR
eukprot:CAMPEP_0183323978 /NCGR_PEP_ID=MMETSP0160_2-20130417/75808_1 /TAXON_ID=2839 ORGANISM="Odontella Sinensis, Strain Grunow 1884" /NCGR_SAMPLE_ID=MMETSP0160_2 /ASSEMBLY_ACC=CAM_ASM_000250 /LENGTH=40 /DNA_ID= /DNA_START= /DNA_END= /DNA_ORIENTATION=